MLLQLELLNGFYCVGVPTHYSLCNGRDDCFYLSVESSTPNFDVNIKQARVTRKGQWKQHSLSLHWHEQWFQKRLSVYIHFTWSWHNLGNGFWSLSFSESVSSAFAINLRLFFHLYQVSSEVIDVDAVKLDVVIDVFPFNGAEHALLNLVLFLSVLAQVGMQVMFVVRILFHRVEKLQLGLFILC